MSIYLRTATCMGIAVALFGCRSTDSVAPSGDPASSTALAREHGGAGVLLLEDDFSAPLIDPRKWTTITDLPTGGAVVRVDGGHAVLINRGYLVSVGSFSPTRLGGIRLSGDWVPAGAGDDFLQVLTRSDGLLDPASPYGEARQGIEFVAFTSLVPEAPSNVYISGRGAAQGTIARQTSEGALVITPGRRYHFEILDNGEGLRFTVSDAMNPEASRTVSARSLFRTEENHLVFHNREACCGGLHRMLLDNVQLFSHAR
jgi:hypothetical protein